MNKSGHYKLPNPWGFVEAAKRAIEESESNYIGFSWFGEKEDPIVGQTKAYCCPDCQDMIIDSLKRINKTFDKTERKQILDELLNRAKELDCKHYEEFQTGLEESRKSKRKTPTRRMHDYYEHIINEKTGSKVCYPDDPEL